MADRFLTCFQLIITFILYAARITKFDLFLQNLIFDSLRYKLQITTSNMAASRYLEFWKLPVTFILLLLELPKFYIYSVFDLPQFCLHIANIKVQYFGRLPSWIFLFPITFIILQLESPNFIWFLQYFICDNFHYKLKN